MQNRGELRVNPSPPGAGPFSEELEVVVLYTDPVLAGALLRKATVLTRGLQARIVLLAVHTVPLPADFRCAVSTHSFLVDHLMELAADCRLPVNAQVVLARSREDGFLYAIPPGSIVLVGTHKHLWPTSEERLAGQLAAAGHRVSIVHI